jgi:hypothetical protein
MSRCVASSGAPRMTGGDPYSSAVTSIEPVSIPAESTSEDSITAYAVSTYATAVAFCGSMPNTLALHRSSNDVAHDTHQSACICTATWAARTFSCACISVGTSLRGGPDGHSTHAAKPSCKVWALWRPTLLKAERSGSW